MFFEVPTDLWTLTQKWTYPAWDKCGRRFHCCCVFTYIFSKPNYLSISNSLLCFHFCFVQRRGMCKKMYANCTVEEARQKGDFQDRKGVIYEFTMVGSLTAILLWELADIRIFKQLRRLFKIYFAEERQESHLSTCPKTSWAQIQVLMTKC